MKAKYEVNIYMVVNMYNSSDYEEFDIENMEE